MQSPSPPGREASDPPLDNLLRLSFDSIEEFHRWAQANGKMLDQIWAWHETLGDREGSFQLPGICDLCQLVTSFTAWPQRLPEGGRFASQVAWQNMNCGCGLSSIDRAVFRVFLDGGAIDDRVYHVGHYSLFRQWLNERLPELVDSQYDQGRRPGEIDGDVRYEDLTVLSFGDGKFDCAIAIDVLEHVAHYRSALREIARVLRPGGRALLTFPWLGGNYYDHFIRAEAMPDGSINHLHPPEYHGDPASSEGILSFRAFGWKILDDMREAGFSRASVTFIFGPLHGHMTFLSPVIVGVR